MRVILLASLLLGLPACVTEPAPPPKSAVEHGLWLLQSTAASPSTSNHYACTTCHALTEVDGANQILPGATLAGAIARPSYWGGATRDLLPAINTCRFWFMDAQQPWQASDPEAAAVWGWLETSSAALPLAVTWTVVGTITDIPPGQAAPGESVYQAACAVCHGAVHTGLARLTPQAQVLPEEFLASHTEYTPADRRLIAMEKVRHGPFLGYGGRMPPFSREVLSDAQLADLLAYLGL